MHRMRSLIFILACLLPLANAMAEHEADHRYQVQGFVLDGNDDAIAGRVVAISAGGELLARGTTDSFGYYSLHLHLHDEDRGRLLNLRAGPDAVAIRVAFDPEDKHTARVHTANLVGGKLVETELRRWRTPAWIYPLAGFILLGFILVVLERRRKRKLRQKHFSHPAAPRGQRGKKKRRK
jgi:hypothetical protein